MQFEESFFKPEVRNNFKISAMMKRAWAAEMEVLEVIINVCKKTILNILLIGELCLEPFVTRVLYRGMVI